MADDPFDRALGLLARHFGFTQFRPVQERVVRSVLGGTDTLAILPTGAGKSICFQIPALVRGDLTVVISPLLALMEDQVAAAKARGIPARALNSLQSPRDQRGIMTELEERAVRLLYVSPERCPRLATELADRQLKVGMLAVDEAHCIAEWGADFRPSYRALGRFRRQVGNPGVVALTGSATPAVRQAIASTLGLGVSGGYHLHVASFDRRNLAFEVRHVASEAARLRELLAQLGTEDRVAIVYGATRNTVDALARVLRERGFQAASYHAGLAKEERGRVLADFLADRLEVVTATCAFGMGIDKPNVRLVVHWTMPATPESYYQEAGRAGRDGRTARCVLLYRRGDAALGRRELDVTFPEPHLVEAAWRDPGFLATLPRHVAASVERLRSELRPGRQPVRWNRVLARRALGLRRLEAVERYATDRRCRREALLAYFGERLLRCSGCDVCGDRVLTRQLDRPARERLRRLRAAVAGPAAPFGGALLDGATLAALAADPPLDVDQLAARPGVGVEVADRLGATMLAALGGALPLEPPSDAGYRSLAAWRAEEASTAGVARFRIASNAVLQAVAAASPTSLAGLARVSGVGPRFLSKYGDRVLAALGRRSELEANP